MAENKRFKVALSFPGEKRDFIEEVAGHLSFALSQEKVFYDDYYLDELAIPNLDIVLSNIYKDHSDLVVYFLCEDYSKKKWCGVEWRVVRDILFHKRGEDLMQFRFDDFPVEGALAIDGFIPVKKKTAKEISELILKRVRKNQDAFVQKLIINSTEAMSRLQKVEGELNDLKTIQDNTPTLAIKQQIETLALEKETLKLQLLQQRDIIAQQEKTRQELESSLAAEQGKEELKRKALIAVEEKNYDEAEKLVKEAAQERIEKVAEDFYQLGKIKELKLEYREALDYYELAAKIAPDNTDYLTKAGRLCKTFGFLGKALDYHQKALDFDLNTHGEEHENTAID